MQYSLLCMMIDQIQTNDYSTETPWMPNSIKDQTKCKVYQIKCYKTVVQQCVHKYDLEFLGRVLPLYIETLFVFLPKYMSSRRRKHKKELNIIRNIALRNIVYDLELFYYMNQFRLLLLPQ